MRALLIAALVLGLGCGCAAASHATAQPGACRDVSWGGWDGSPECRALAERTIRGADRACASDRDCVIVHAGASCREISVARGHEGAYAGLPAACTHPAGGPCPPAAARCEAGCCVASP